mmetsp:Transcript_23220/g.50791  ORF Transcript_23220/g.50791 Transcript_23220/m.50791 type:complete len:208 (-) Transcript_23220:200-823(-)
MISVASNTDIWSLIFLPSSFVGESLPSSSASTTPHPSSPARRSACSKSGGPINWLRTITETRVASSFGPQLGNFSPISLARPNDIPACVTYASHPHRRKCVGAPTITQPTYEPAASETRRIVKRPSAIGHARSSTPRCMPMPVVKKKKQSTGGMVECSSAVSRRRSPNGLHTINPATMHESIGSSRGVIGQLNARIAKTSKGWAAKA